MAGPTRKIQSQTLAAFLAQYEFQLVGALIEDSEYGRNLDSLLTSSLQTWGRFAGQVAYTGSFQ